MQTQYGVRMTTNTSKCIKPNYAIWKRNRRKEKQEIPKLWSIINKKSGLSFHSWQKFHWKTSMEPARWEKKSINILIVLTNIFQFFLQIPFFPNRKLKDTTIMTSNQDALFNKASTITNLRALANADVNQTIFYSGKKDNLDTATNYDSANAVFQSASESDLMEKAAVLNIHKEGDLTILSYFHKHTGGK